MSCSANGPAFDLGKNTSHSLSCLKSSFPSPANLRGIITLGDYGLINRINCLALNKKKGPQSSVSSALMWAAHSLVMVSSGEQYTYDLNSHFYEGLLMAKAPNKQHMFPVSGKHLSLSLYSVVCFSRASEQLTRTIKKGGVSSGRSYENALVFRLHERR